MRIDFKKGRRIVTLTQAEWAHINATKALLAELAGNDEDAGKATIALCVAVDKHLPQTKDPS